MDDSTPTGSQQQALWNGPAGQAWVDEQEMLDRLYAPFARLLVERLARTSPAAVLDIGCGAGGTTLAIARQLGAAARCVGVDISAPLVAAARARAAGEGLTVEFLCADAQTQAFEPATFDAIVSRFGVMFFDDPVRAFTNLRQAAQSGASLRFIAWRSVAENPFMIAAERAAAPLLPNLPPRRADGPGQFGFADAQRVRAILDDSGWTAIDIQPIDVACSLAEADLDRYHARFGPVAQQMREADEPTRARVREVVRAAFEPYLDAAVARFTAACWVVDACAGAHE